MLLIPSLPLTKELTVTLASSSLEFLSNVVHSSFVAAVVEQPSTKQNEEWVCAMVDISDTEMADGAVNESTEIFVEGVAHPVNENVVQIESSLARGSKLASSSPNDVMVALFAGEKENVSPPPSSRHGRGVWYAGEHFFIALSLEQTDCRCVVVDPEDPECSSELFVWQKSSLDSSPGPARCKIWLYCIKQKPFIGHMISSQVWFGFPAVAIFAMFLASSRILSVASIEGLVFTPTASSWLKNSNLMDASPVSASTFGFKALGRCVIRNI
ncbi:hypothetical protein Tco_0491477 [Tanacetum coccineum]